MSDFEFDLTDAEAAFFQEGDAWELEQDLEDQPVTALPAPSAAVYKLTEG